MVIDNMCDRWLGDAKMADYLRPDTLFRPKFEGYLNMGKRNHFKKYHDLLEEFPEGGDDNAGQGQARIPEDFLDVV